MKLKNILLFFAAAFGALAVVGVIKNPGQYIRMNLMNRTVLRVKELGSLRRTQTLSTPMV